MTIELFYGSDGRGTIVAHGDGIAGNPEVERTYKMTVDLNESGNSRIYKDYEEETGINRYAIDETDPDFIEFAYNYFDATGCLRGVYYEGIDWERTDDKRGW